MKRMPPGLPLLILFTPFASLSALAQDGAAPASHPECPPGQHWDPSSMGGMGMCVADQPARTHLDFHLNDFLVGIAESGPRGRVKLGSPDMFMLDFTQAISSCDSVQVEWMGTTELWTLPQGGMPELFQVGEANAQGKPYVDAQHPHSTPIMGLTFAEAHCLSPDGDRKISFFFAPRGEATAGPQAFMHRSSADGNPNVPLAHHLQDVFHVMSTVLGTRFQAGKWSIEGSVFSGREQRPAVVSLDLPPIDSVGTRIERKLGKDVRVGGSVASTLDRGANEPLARQMATRQTALSAWIMTDHQWRRTSLSTSNIWGQTEQNHLRLESFLNEMSLRFGQMQKDHLFSRFEVLERTPDQLQVNVSGSATDPRWIEAITVGYDRELLKKDSVSLYVGGSATQDFAPSAFKLAYGGDPRSGEIHLRVVFKRSKSWNAAKPDPMPMPMPPVAEPTYAWISRHIIAPKCASCHTTTQGDGDGLGSANFDSYAGLMKVVTPGAPEESRIYRAVKSRRMPKAMEMSPDAHSGSQMEMPQPNYLTEVELKALSDWILAGAKQN